MRPLFFKNGVTLTASPFFKKVVERELRKELERELNERWIARAKANDELMECIAKLDRNGYTFKWSDRVEKQFELIKKDEIKQK